MRRRRGGDSDGLQAATTVHGPKLVPPVMLGVAACFPACLRVSCLAICVSVYLSV